MKQIPVAQNVSKMSLNVVFEKVPLFTDKKKIPQ